MTTYLILDSNNNVINMIDWDGEAPWSPPEGYRVLPYDGPAWQGGKWDGTTVTEPPPPAEPKPRPTSGNVHIIGE